MGEFDLPHVKTADARNFVMFVDDGRGLPLGLGEDNVGEVGAGGDNTYLLEVVVRHDCSFTTATSGKGFVNEMGSLLSYMDMVTLSIALRAEGRNSIVGFEQNF